MSLLSKYKISGHSMMPALKPNQEILVSSLPYLFKNPSKGEIVAFKNENQHIIKRIKEVGDGKFLVQGDNQKDSKEYGWISKNLIIGKVIYIIPS